MTRTRDFFWKCSAKAFADDLKRKGFLDALVTPRGTWGPRDAWHIPFSGWRVSWIDYSTINNPT